jgi:hypothetical protein
MSGNIVHGGKPELRRPIAAGTAQPVGSEIDMAIWPWP